MRFVCVCARACVHVCVYEHTCIHAYMHACVVLHPRFLTLTVYCRTVTPTPTFKLSKRRKLESDPIEQEILQQLRSTSCTTKSVPDDDEDFAYGRNIVFSFMKLQPHLKVQAKIKIQQLLYDLEFSQQIRTEPVQLNPHTFSTV